jgi:hypothetical protein
MDEVTGGDSSQRRTNETFTFLPPTPEEMHRPKLHGGYPDVPYISDRSIAI